MPKTRHIYISCIYDALDNRYGFSISVRHGIDCTIFHSFFSWKVWKKMFFKIFKSWQVWDWLAKWIIMLRFMDLRWLRVFRRSNVGLVVFMLNKALSMSMFMSFHTILAALRHEAMTWINNAQALWRQWATLAQSLLLIWHVCLTTVAIVAEMRYRFAGFCGCLLFAWDNHCLREDGFWDVFSTESNFTGYANDTHTYIFDTSLNITD